MAPVSHCVFGLHLYLKMGRYDSPDAALTVHYFYRLVSVTHSRSGASYELLYTVYSVCSDSTHAYVRCFGLLLLLLLVRLPSHRGIVGLYAC